MESASSGVHCITNRQKLYVMQQIMSRRFFVQWVVYCIEVDRFWEEVVVQAVVIPIPDALFEPLQPVKYSFNRFVICQEA